MAVIHGLFKICPLSRVRQLLGLEVTRIPHDAVARSRESFVVAIGIVDGKGADFFGNTFDLDLILDQQIIALENLEGVWRRGPEHIGGIAARRFLKVLDTGGGLLLEHLDLDVGILLLEGLLEGTRGVLGIRGDDGEGAFHGQQCQRRCQQ